MERLARTGRADDGWRRGPIEQRYDGTNDRPERAGELNPAVTTDIQMKLDLAGKIRNTQLSRTKALFPMFETVVNSLQAIEDARGGEAARTIEISVERDAVLEDFETEGTVTAFTVTDTGVGFTD